MSNIFIGKLFKQFNLYPAFKTRSSSSQVSMFNSSCQLTKISSLSSGRVNTSKEFYILATVSLSPYTKTDAMSEENHLIYTHIFIY
jgi:hypothetical protein